MSNKIYIYEESLAPEVNFIKAPPVSTVNIVEPDNHVIYIYEPGPMGRPGRDGVDGNALPGAPELPEFGTRGQYLAKIDEVSYNVEWKTLVFPDAPFYYVSSTKYETTASLSFLGDISSSFSPITNSNFNLGSDTKQWNNLFVSKSIFISNNEIIKNISSTQTTFNFTSGSVSASFDNGGIFRVSEFENFPDSIPSAGIIKVGSDLYLGI